MHTRRTSLRAGGIAVLTAIALVALSACSSSPSTGGTDGSASAGTTDSASAALLAAAYKGVVSAPPTTAVAVTPGEKIWVVSCGQSQTTCSNPAGATLAAGKAIGWTGSVCDGKLNPAGWSACIRSGIAAKADIIFTAGLDCAPISAALTEAKAAGIKTIGIAGNDCDVSGGSKEFTATTTELSGYTSEQWWNLLGKLQADYLIGKANGAAKVLELTFGDAIWGPFITAGFKAELAKSPKSSIVATLPITNADVGSGALTQKFSTALLQNPSVNSIAVPLDGWFLAGLAQAIKSSANASKLTVIGGLGSVANYGLIGAGGGENATVAFSGQWDGYGGIDAALRVLKGVPLQPAGNGLQVVDATHNLPASGQDFAFNPVVDYASKFLAAWGK